MAERDNEKKQERVASANPDERSLDSGRLEMRLPASAEWVRVVRLATAGVASRVGFSYDEVEDIKLAVAEACNNAIIHSKSGEGSPLVTVRWQVLPDGVRISVSDEGRLDPPGIVRRTPGSPDEASFDNLPEGGMGLLLIEGLMDEVEHESGPESDTTIHMTKRLVANAPEKAEDTPPRPHPDAPVALRTSTKKSISEGASRPVR